MLHLCRLLGLLLLVSLFAGAAQAQSIKVAKTAPPKELKDKVRSLLSDQSVQFLNGKGTVVAEVWLRKEYPTKATPEQIKKGITYAALPETMIMGVIHIKEKLTDYRKQTLKPGVYTMRLGMQPMDGDHNGTAPYNEFCLLVPAADDEGAAAMTPKELHEVSGKASGASHPAIILLFPNENPKDAPELVDKGNGHQVLMIKVEAKVGDKKVPMGIGLTLIGVSPAA